MEATETPTASSLTARLVEDDRPIVKSQGGDGDGGRSTWRDELFEESKKQLGLAGPLIAVNFMLSLSQLFSSMFVGHLGNLALSGSSLASSFASLTGFSVLVSFPFPILFDVPIFEISFELLLSVDTTTCYYL